MSNKKAKTREQILENLKMSELEEGRSGLVAKFLAENKEVEKQEVKKIKK